jgi:hypothetical protein
LVMPPKAAGAAPGPKKRNQGPDNGKRGPPSSSVVQPAQDPRLASASSQSKFIVAPLVVEGTNFNKLQFNDMIKLQMSDIRLTDIQLSRAGIFTLYAADVKSFNRLLNDLPPLLASNGQPAQSKVYVPRSIQRIKDTDKVAFVKRVDPEIPNDRILEALKSIGLEATNVMRLTGKDGNTATRTVKVTLATVENRNTFVHTGLQVDAMHFVAEAATQNTKPVQCYMCLQYNHVAKYCKTKQQVCARCGDSHRLDQCTAANDTLKCCNCNGNHLATSFECSKYKEQEKKARNMVNLYSSSSTSKPTPQAPAIHSASEFPPLRSPLQLQQQQLPTDFLEKIISALSSQMEKIIEETTTRLLSSFQQKIEQLEKSFLSRYHTTAPPRTNRKPKKTTKATHLQTIATTTAPSVDTADYSTLSSDDEGSVSVKRHIKEVQRLRRESQISDTAASATTAVAAAAVNTAKAKKKAKKQQEKAAVAAATTPGAKRPISLNNSLDASTAANKEQKTSDDNNNA